VYTVIGLGGVGCRVAKCFSEYPQYNIVCIDDVNSDWKDQMVVRKQPTPEMYEESFTSLTKKVKQKIKEEIIFVLSGSSDVSAIALRILQELKRKKVTILYVRPEIDLLDQTSALQERVIYSVLQEYTRSGLFEKMYLTNNSTMDSMVVDAGVRDYYPTINNLIASCLHMVNVFDHGESIVGNFSKINVARRVCTLGILNMESGEESLFSPFEDAMNTRLYYGISKDSLNNDKNLQRNIIRLIKDKSQDLCKYSYGVYETQYETDFCYIKTYSSKVQEF
tara:strand:+ start:359 stop:1195 length:837 start_codon:yes stop_codon:yes gene_type:complete